MILQIHFNVLYKKKIEIWTTAKSGEWVQILERLVYIIIIIKSGTKRGVRFRYNLIRR